MFLGVLASIFAGALWGLAFIAPLVAYPYSPLDITMGRYVVYGVISLFVLSLTRFSALKTLPWRGWMLICLLGFTGNVGYYLALSLAVPRAGPAVVALIIGCLPVVMAVFGNKDWHHIPRAKLIPSLGLITGGLILVNGSALAQARLTGTAFAFLSGTALTLVAVTLWSWYGLRNARVLAELPALSSAQLTAMVGIGTLLTLWPVLVVGLISRTFTFSFSDFDEPEFGRLILWSVLLGGFSSWAAGWAWSVATRYLSIALSSQLIVFETIFALLYSAAYSMKIPDWPEVFGSTLLIAGVVVALRTMLQLRLAKPISEAIT